MRYAEKLWGKMIKKDMEKTEVKTVSEWLQIRWGKFYKHKTH